MVKGPGVGCKGRGDLGVRFDRINELRGRRERSLSLSKGWGREQRGRPVVLWGFVSTIRQAQNSADSTNLGWGSP